MKLVIYQQNENIKYDLKGCSVFDRLIVSVRLCFFPTNTFKLDEVSNFCQEYKIQNNHREQEQMQTHLGTWYLYLGKIALRNCLTILIHFSSCWTLSFYYQGLCYHSGSCKLTVYLKGMVISSALAKAISSSGFKVIMNQCTPNLEVETTLSTPKKDSPLSSSSHSL